MLLLTAQETGDGRFDIIVDFVDCLRAVYFKDLFGSFRPVKIDDRHACVHESFCVPNTSGFCLVLQRLRKAY